MEWVELKTFLRVMLIVACLAAVSLPFHSDAASPGATCNVHSGNFARVCSPSSDAGCRRAAKRGVPGFSLKQCDAQAIACGSCISVLHRCVDPIGLAKGPGTKAACDACVARFDRCFDKRYPKK